MKLLVLQGVSGAPGSEGHIPCVKVRNSAPDSRCSLGVQVLYCLLLLLSSFSHVLLRARIV